MSPSGPARAGDLPGRRDEATVLAFVAPWCGPCRRLEPILDEVAASHQAGVRLEKIRVDQHPDLVERDAVRATPTILVRRGGHELARSVGAVNRVELDRLFAIAIAGSAATPQERAGRRVNRTDGALRLGAGASLVVAGAVLGPHLALLAIGLLVLAWAAFGSRKAMLSEPPVPGVSGSVR